MLNRTLAHYQITQKLGQGGMGEVYLAHDQKLGRDVALKILPKDLAEDAERRKRFEREARAIAAFKHPNIVTLYSIEDADGVHFLTMEHVEGETLASEVRTDGLLLERFFELSIPLADALSAAHAKGIAHRDIKPANIMLDETGRLKILDFGLAKLFESDPDPDQTIAASAESVTSEGRILGTVAYMSPEQAEGKSIDARSDVFSLGVVLYELATGTRPFQGDTNISTMSAILRDDPPSVSDLRPVAPRHLGRIIARCLAKDPDRRYQSALDVRNELEELRREEDSQLSSVSDLGTAPTPATGASRRLVLGAVGVAMLAAVVFGIFQRGGDSTTESPMAVTTPPAPPDQDLRRIVVFPFENLGGADDAYFAAGITDEITSRLARVGELSVMSRTSAVQYDRTGKTMQQIRSDLQVDYVLEGTVRWEKRSDGTSRVRVTPQLIHAADDSNIWGDNYDRSMDEIFTVQSEIAEQVVAKLNVALVPSEQRALEDQLTDNVEAWHAYQRGLNAENGNMDDPATWELAVNMYQRAADLDPDFVQAQARLAISHAAFIHWQFDNSSERLALCKAAADRTFEIRPESPWSYMALGYYHYHGKKEYEPAWKAFQKASEGLPDNIDVYGALGAVLRRQGRFEEALDYFERATAIDPRHVYGYVNVAETAGSILGRHMYAVDQLDRAISVLPDLRLAYQYKAFNYAYMGDAKNAVIALETPLLATSDAEFGIESKLYLVLGNPEKALALASSLSDELIDEQFSVISRSYLQGLAHREMGDAAAARIAFERSLVALEQRVKERPDDARVRSALGLAYAGAGRAEDAVREGEYAVEIYPNSIDAYIAPHRVADLAVIHTLLGQDDRALDYMEKAVGLPPSSVLAPGWIKLDPLFDGMRDNPRFQALLGRT